MAYTELAYNCFKNTTEFATLKDKSLRKYFKAETTTSFLSISSTNRSSRLQMFFKIDVVKNFVKFTGKHLCWSLYLINLLVFRPAILLKTSSTLVFSCENCHFFKINFLIETLLLPSSLKALKILCLPYSLLTLMLIAVLSK